MIHICIQLSSHYNFIRLKVAIVCYRNVIFKQDGHGNQLKWKIDTLNPKGQQNMFVIICFIEL